MIVGSVTEKQNPAYLTEWNYYLLTSSILLIGMSAFFISSLSSTNSGFLFFIHKYNFSIVFNLM